MKRHRLTEAEERRLAEAIAAEARAMATKRTKCRRKQSDASGHGYLKPFLMNERPAKSRSHTDCRTGPDDTLALANHCAAAKLRVI